MVAANARLQSFAEGDIAKPNRPPPDFLTFASQPPCTIDYNPGQHWLRTSPNTAHALPAPVIGIRFLDPSPPGLTGREVMGHEPSLRWVLIRNARPRSITGSRALSLVWPRA